MQGFSIEDVDRKLPEHSQGAYKGPCTLCYFCSLTLHDSQTAVENYSMSCYSMECVRRPEEETNSSHTSGSCAVCVKVKGATNGRAALTGTLPRYKASAHVCLSLAQSWLDRFLSCLLV